MPSDTEVSARLDRLADRLTRTDHLRISRTGAAHEIAAIAALTPTASEATAIGAEEALGAMLICDQTGGRMFTQWPVTHWQEQDARSIYGDCGGYRTVPLYAAAPKVASDTAPGVREALQAQEDRADLMADEYCGVHHDDLSPQEQIRWTTYREGALAGLATSKEDQ